MFIFLIVVITVLAFLMILTVLLQSGKGGGLAGIAAGGATRQILGARQAPDILEKATWTLATLFIVLCILTPFTIDRGTQQESVIQQRAREATPQQAAPMPQDAPNVPVLPQSPDGVEE